MNGFLKKAVFSVGLIYIIWGLWLVIGLIRFAPVYQEFGADPSRFAYVVPMIILGYGAAQVTAAFLKIKKMRYYWVFLATGVFFLGIWVFYIVTASLEANKVLESYLESGGVLE